jgi:hypothetical protein
LGLSKKNWLVVFLRKLVIVIAMLFLFLNSNFVSADDDEIDYSKAIMRQVVTKIEWDDFNKRIVVHKIVIQKYKDDPLQTYPTENVLDSESLKGKTLTDVQAEEFVREYGADNFNSDIIFGHTVKVFKDLSMDHNVTKDKIDKWVKLAQQQVEKDYLSPPEFKDSDIAWSKFLRYLIYVILAMVLYIFIARTVRFFKKDR